MGWQSCGFYEERMIDITSVQRHTGEVYQPIPFPEYVGIKAKRNDCGERYRVIKANYGDFKGKTLIDICCANGYFPFRFLQDGGMHAMGIDINKELVNFNNKLAEEKDMKFVCVLPDKEIDIDFDIGIYLDTHYSTGTEDYLKFLATHAEVCFTSCTCNGNGCSNEEYQKQLKRTFKNVEPIHQGFAGRIIYKCY